MMTTGEMGPKLEACNKQVPVSPQVFALSEAGCTLGRVAPATLVVEGRYVSRRHAAITVEGSRFVLKDAGSVNGTFVNGERIEEAYVLQHFDVIGLGEPEPALRFVDVQQTAERARRLRYNEQRKLFTFDGRELVLSPLEQRFLAYLYTRRPNLCTASELSVELWGNQIIGEGRDDRLDGVVRNVRAKLKAIAEDGGTCIRTRSKRGYELIG